MKRTHSCNALRGADQGKDVTLCGWVRRRRALGNLIFVDLRDREGITQIVFDPAAAPEAYEVAKDIRGEYVICVNGKVRSRGDQINKDLPTGEIEVLASSIKIFNTAETPPFHLENEDPTDDLRLRYRYLDLRRAHLQKALGLRHKVALAVRNCLDSLGFWEIETPVLSKSTPEGARDYLVPSRVHHGKFYALPQSPQLLKQLLMVAGMDKYFQITRCFRDEDLRAERQPEFTQIDLEMSFAEKEDVFEVGEAVMKTAFATAGYKIETPFPHMTWQDAMDGYGSDKPDLRFGMVIQNVTDIFKSCAFPPFASALEEAGSVRCIKVEGGASLPRRRLDELNEVAKKEKAKGIFYVKYEAEGRKSPIKGLTDEEWAALEKQMSPAEGDLLILSAGPALTACKGLGAVRLQLGQELKLIPENTFAFTWITDFPLFQYSEEEGRWVSEHHPFTSPNALDFDILESDPGHVRSNSYDLVINGYEVGSGSVRIHDSKLQDRIFRLLKLEPQQIEDRFGFFINALKYGAPPHAGVAFGLDRLTMLLTGRNNIRDVIAFPKTLKATDLMSDAPSTVSPEQLDELAIAVTRTEEEELQG